MIDLLKSQISVFEGLYFDRCKEFGLLVNKIREKDPELARVLDVLNDIHAFSAQVRSTREVLAIAQKEQEQKQQQN